MHTETETDFDQMVLSPSPDPPSSPTLNRLKKTNPTPSPNHQDRPELDESDGLDPLFSERSAKRALEFTTTPGNSDSENEMINKKAIVQPEESDGLDPLFSEEVPKLDRKFVEPEESDGLDPLFPEGVPKLEREFVAPPEYDSVDLSEMIDSAKWKNKKKRKSVGGGGGGGGKRVVNQKLPKQKKKEEAKAHLAQQADFQRIMRERKSVGFKPLPMVEKPISSFLEKIRQRKVEMSKMMTGSRSEQKPVKEVVLLDDDEEDGDFMLDLKIDSGTSQFDAPANEASEDKSCSRDERSPNNNILEEDSEKPFRPPVDDTQDLFSDSEASDSQENPSTDAPGSPVEDISPSLPSLNLILDSAHPDDSSSDEEESDKENTAPLPKPLRKNNFSGTRDPMKNFLDEEALEDDSDNDLHLEDEDEENDADMEEHCDYIDTKYKEKPTDLEKRKQLDRTLCQQQDDAEVEKIIQRYNPGAKQQEPTLLEVDDEDEAEDEDDIAPEVEEDESDTEDTGMLTTRVTTKMLKQMIPQMFTDEDDGYVSSEDEETERSLSNLLKKKKEGYKLSRQQKAEPDKKTNSISKSEYYSSKEALGRIKNLNSVSDTKKKAKTLSFFDPLLAKESSSNSYKSSFLRRASSHSLPSINPAPSSHKQGSSTGRSYIFGRDDSRSSSSIPEDLGASNPTEAQVKKVVSAKFSGSQVKRLTQETLTTGEKGTGASLFEILKQSCIQTGHDTHDNMVDQQAVFASFKSVKKQIKVSGSFLQR